jgi:hypothetical protein
LPLRGREIGARRIVTAGVNQDHVAFGSAVEVFEHRFESQPVGGRIVVGVALEAQTGTAQ